MSLWKDTIVGPIMLGVLALALAGYTGDYTAKLNDEQIQAAVQKRLAMDGRIDPSMIVVKVEDGQVTLSGMVKTWEEKILADAIVSSTVVGVRSLVNNILVQPPLQTKDPALKIAVENALASVPALRGSQITVNVHNGIVKLEGSVEKPLHYRAAEKAAKRVPGVIAVTNLIKVQGLRRPDNEIEKDVVTYLQWSPLVNIDQFDYIIRDGVIKLKGTVDHLAHRYALEEDLEKINGVVAVDLSEVTVKKQA